MRPQLLNLTDRPSLLWAKVERLVLLSAIELPQVFLLLLVHHYVDTGHGLSNNADLGQFRGSSASHLMIKNISKYISVLEGVLFWTKFR